MSDLIRNLANEQRKRLVATLLGYAESEFRQQLDDEQWEAFRSKVMTAVGQYHDFILDVIKANRGDELRNDEAVELIRLVHDSQRRLERRIG